MVTGAQRLFGSGRIAARLFGSALLLAAAVQAQAQAGAPAGRLDSGRLYTVAPVTFDLRAEETVGAKRSGSLCLPAGSIRWRDAKPDGADAREAVALAARGAGLSVGAADNPFDQGVTGVDRAIRVRMRGLHLTACVPAGGLGRLVRRSMLVKGDGLIALEWRIYARNQDAPVATGQTCTAVTYRGDPGALDRMTLTGIGAATTRFVAELKHVAAGPITIEDDGCRRLRLGGGAASPDE